MNEAFIIDNETKDALIKENAKSAEIIKAVLRGRDIQRWRAQWASLWIIDSHNGFDGAGPIDISEYPAVKAHLDGFGGSLAYRQDQGRTPYNLRNCAYHEEFKKEKLFWIDLTEEGRFVYEAQEMFCVNSAYMMTGKSIKYLCAVLNSNIVTWFMRNSALNSGMGTTRWVRFTVERIPVPALDRELEQGFTDMVQEIMHLGEADAKMQHLQATLNQRVCALYGLSKEESIFVNGK